MLLPRPSYKLFATVVGNTRARILCKYPVTSKPSAQYNHDTCAERGRLMLMSALARHYYEFGVFTLDTTQRLLLRAGKVVALTPKVFETLLVLV